MLEGWSEFLIAAAGAAAALAGLILAAMSVSIDALVKIPGMTSRGATAIAMLVLVTVVGLAGLIPGQGPFAFGVEVVVISAIGLMISLQSLWVLLRTSQGPRAKLAALTKGVLSIVPFAAFVGGGVLVISGLAASGLLWLAFGTLAAFVIAVVAAWVMLVEIRR
jgi:hypothetical protein